jgi:hypothetical protein
MQNREIFLRAVARSTIAFEIVVCFRQIIPK